MDTIPNSGTYAFYNDYFKDVYLLDEYEGRYDSANVSIDGIEDRDLNPLCQTAESYYLSATKAGDLFTNGINFVGDLPESLKGFLFFYHGDHLGSASWITDVNGDPVQYLHYAPYGELIANQNGYGYDERFKFTGKERDEESGYDYFGARYYDHRKGFWNSVDPLADEYPNETPYLYCGGNPVMLVDPDGRKPRMGRRGESRYVDDVTCRSLTDQEVTSYIQTGSYTGQRCLEFETSESSETITPYRIGVEWLTGKGERNRVFVGADNFTQQLKKHYHIENMQQSIVESIKNGIYEGDNDYDLSGIQGIPKYFGDYTTLLTGGRSGNLAVTYLGSYNLSWSVLDIKNGQAIVLFEVTNASKLASGTRPPFLGYTHWWKNTVGAFIDSLFTSGALSRTTQKFVWTEQFIIE